MPRGDGTGPIGNGPINGICVNRNFGAFNSRARRRGFKFGFRQDYPSVTKNDLEQEKELLETRLKEIQEITK